MPNFGRRKFFTKFISTLALTSFLSSNSFAQADYFIPGFLINIFLKKKFPINKDLIFIKLELSDPDLNFISQNQRLTMSSAFSALIIGNTPINGQLHFSSSFRYDALNKAIKLKEPVIDKLNVQSLGEKGGQSLQQVNLWIAKLLENMTVYEFKENEISLFKKPPSKILVEDAGLRLYFD